MALAAAMTAAAPAAASSSANIASEGASLAAALDGQTMQLTRRGTTVTVMASAVAAEDGCASVIAANAPGATRKWTRLLRWSELAWVGDTPDGRTMISFFDHEGRLPGDRAVFAPADGAAFRAAVARVAGNCRTTQGEAARVTIGSGTASRQCYFAQLPHLELADASSVAPARAMLTVYSRETPEAELQLLFEGPRGAVDHSHEQGHPAMAFTFADPGLKDMRIATASFAFDGKPVTAQHSVTAYGDTRLRIALGPASNPTGGKGTESFYRRLASDAEATLTLSDTSQQTRAVLHFDAGAALAAARRALAAADWSCAGAVPPPPPAASWQPED